jgi:hypothetical protein
MRVVTLPDGAISANVLAAAGSPLFLGTEEVSTTGGPFVTTGGDQTAAPTHVGDGATATVQTVAVDTTGLGIAGAYIWCTASVALAAVEGNASIDLEVLLDDAAITPVRIGQRLIAADGTTLGYSLSGLIIIPEGAHTIKLQATTQAGTTADVNPTVAESSFNASIVLFFLAA